ncbi:hypothetical protein CFP56_026357 [Quercus suber]|uniref:Uncharacterized protein n=1 Tax=Quercus suber TaxID=58331 RepID=A0AAW0K195_QUESU
MAGVNERVYTACLPHEEDTGPVTPVCTYNYIGEVLHIYIEAAGATPVNTTVTITNVAPRTTSQQGRPELPRPTSDAAPLLRDQKLWQEGFQWPRPYLVRVFERFRDNLAQIDDIYHVKKT